MQTPKPRLFARPLCGGFTLLEVLIVVVIAVVVTMFSVPAYKKSQDKNRYMAASGVLIDIANAARMVKADYPGLRVTIEIKDNSTCPDDTSDLTPDDGLLKFLQCNKYLNTIPFTEKVRDNQYTYKGYSFKLSTTGDADCGSCRGAMACMSGSNLFSEYTCAGVDKSGQLQNNN